MKYVIIGGGIAGLYTALKLVDIHKIDAKEILVLEKSYRWGRRVHTLKKDGIIYEAGAGRFSDDHKLLLELIKKYNLSDKLISHASKSQYRHILNDKIMIPTNLQPHFEELFLVVEKNKEKLWGKSLFEVATEIFGIEIATLLNGSFGYDNGFKLVNACDNLIMAKMKAMNNSKFYQMIGGLEQIIDALVKDLETKGVNLELNTKCIGWNSMYNDQFNVVITDFNGSESIVTCEKIILALDKWSLLQFKELEPIFNLINSVIITPYTRIYARFPIDANTGFAWFHGIPKTTTNLPLRMFIPLDQTSGMTMISYSDGYHASQWQTDFINGELDKNVMNNIRKLFPEKNIPEPLWIEKIHWANGVHGWKSLIDIDLVYEQIQNPLHNIYICGEVFSKWHGWIEGALETAGEVAEKVAGKNYVDPTKMFSMDDISNSNNLTIINNRVYDLYKMDWINKHPGGSIIKKAIGVDSTHMFKYITHPEYVMNILEDLYVGDLIID
jgi:protoporphyrinogen oxidase